MPIGETLAEARHEAGLTVAQVSERTRIRETIIRGIEHDDYIWQGETRTQSASSGSLSEWSDFSFGEPCVTPLPDGTLLVVLWCIEPSGRGVRYVKLRWEP